MGRSAEFAKKWHVNFQNFKLLKNREDGSDFYDSWTKSIVKTRSSFSKNVAPSKMFPSNRSEPRSMRDRSETEDRTGPDFGTDPTDQKNIAIFWEKLLTGRVGPEVMIAHGV